MGGEPVGDGSVGALALAREAPLLEPLEKHLPEVQRSPKLQSKMLAQGTGVRAGAGVGMSGTGVGMSGTGVGASGTGVGMSGTGVGASGTGVELFTIQKPPTHCCPFRQLKRV